MNIGNISRKDAGAYIVKLENEGGSKTTAINLVVMEKPGPPLGPVNVKEVTAESISISWKRPLEDGGTTISHYTVDKLDPSFGWIEVVDI